jgi:hypothetical protein
LPITATPATMESAMAVRLRALSTECEMNVTALASQRLSPHGSMRTSVAMLRRLDADLMPVDLERNRIASVRGSGCHRQRGENVKRLHERPVEFERTGERRCEPTRDRTCRHPWLL